MLLLVIHKVKDSASLSSKCRCRHGMFVLWNYLCHVIVDVSF